MRTAPPDLARSALDAAPDAMIIIDASGIIRFTNRQVSALFGYEHDEIIGQSIEMLMPERFRARHVGHRENYVSNVRVRPMGVGLELFGRRRDGTEFPVEISLSPIEDVGRTLVAAAIRDVTDRKRVEAELIVAREAAEAAENWPIRRESSPIRRASSPTGPTRARAAFSRPPVTICVSRCKPSNCSTAPCAGARPITTRSKPCRNRSKPSAPCRDCSMPCSTSASSSPERSDPSRPISRSPPFSRSCAWNSRASRPIRDSSSKSKRCNDAVHSDPSLVEQILRNLVSNAVKYTREGWVRLRCLHEAALVRIEVLDTGVGIPADQLPYIYDEFYQVGVPTNVSRDGYGLGLSIVQRLVKLLTLKLDVRSEVGKGSAFSLVLPASSGQDVTTPARDSWNRPSMARSRSGKRACCWWKTMSRCDARRACCSSWRVTTSRRSPRCRKRCNTSSRVIGVDLLISDYHLNDGETGTQVIATLREILGISLRAVLTTGDTSSAIKQLPRDPHLRITSKPIKAEELLTLLRALLAA